MARKSVGKKSRLQTALRIREENIKTYNVELAKLGKEKPKEGDGTKKDHDFLLANYTKKLELAQKEIETIKVRISAA
jgi:hypothetical protein